MSALEAVKDGTKIGTVRHDVRLENTVPGDVCVLQFGALHRPVTIRTTVSRVEKLRVEKFFERLDDLLKDGTVGDEDGVRRWLERRMDSRLGQEMTRAVNGTGNDPLEVLVETFFAGLDTIYVVFWNPPSRS